VNVSLGVEDRAHDEEVDVGARRANLPRRFEQQVDPLILCQQTEVHDDLAIRWYAEAGTQRLPLGVRTDAGFAPVAHAMWKDPDTARHLVGRKSHGVVQWVNWLELAFDDVARDRRPRNLPRE